MISTLTVLPHGLPVILVDTDAFPTVTTLVLVGAGSRYEGKKNNGIAHFFEHMAFKGSRKYPTSFDISSIIEGLGGVFNAFTAKDHTGYWVKAPTEHFDTVVEVLSDMVLHPLLDPQEIEREKNVIVEEINMYEDMPARKISDIFDELLYGGHPLGYDIAGTEQTVRSFQRKTFIDYIGSLYHPKNAVVIVAGGLTKEGKTQDQYLEKVTQQFGSWNGRKKQRIVRYKGKQTKPQLHVTYKKTEQAHFCLGYRAIPLNDPRRSALTVLSAVLGGGMSSRLFMEVRERRGLCYYISTGRELYTDTGHIVTQAGVTNSAEKINEAIAVVCAEHESIANGKITDREIRKAKELLKGRLLISLEDSFQMASLQGTRYLFEQQIVDPKKIIEKLERVGKDDIVGLARELFVEKHLNIALIGPYTAEDIQL